MPPPVIRSGSWQRPPAPPVVRSRASCGFSSWYPPPPWSRLTTTRTPKDASVYRQTASRHSPTGIFAVAMTILVLELHVPDLGPLISESSLLSALIGIVPKALSFGSGFIILGTLWIGHRYQFHYIRRSDRAILWINLVFLLTISFLPFVVALIGTYGAMRVTCLSSMARHWSSRWRACVQWLYATGSSRRLVGPTLPQEVFVGLRNRVLMGMIGYGGGLVLAFFAAAREPDLLRGDSPALPAAGPF